MFLEYSRIQKEYKCYCSEVNRFIISKISHSLSLSNTLTLSLILLSLMKTFCMFRSRTVGWYYCIVRHYRSRHPVS